MRKVLITGTGKSGTTFLVHLLTALGEDTGYTLENIKSKIDPKSGGGLEWPIRGKKSIDPSPRIIKSPVFCWDINNRILKWGWEVERVFVLFRPYKNVAEHKFHRGRNLYQNDEISVRMDQAASKIGYLMEQLVESDLPHTFIKFPKAVEDYYYLYDKLYPTINVEFKEFREAHQKVADTKLVHWR